MLRHVVWYILTDVSEELAASIIRVMSTYSFQKTATFILITMRT
jgi:hypothetical protein